MAVMQSFRIVSSEVNVLGICFKRTILQKEGFKGASALMPVCGLCRFSGFAGSYSSSDGHFLGFHTG
jgi:hypothetical protein